MHKLLVASVLLSAGCGTIFNKQHKDIRMAPGVTVNGETTYATIDQRAEHTVEYADGRPSCKIRPGVSAAYIVLDIFTTGPIGLIVDAITGDWTVAKSDCPGVAAR